MTTGRVTPNSIDQYIAAFSPEVQAILQKIRATIGNAAPDARETISYQIPAFMLNGPLVYFAAFKKHIGFYPPVRGDARLENAIAPYGRERESAIPARSSDPIPSDRTHREAPSEAKPGEGGDKKEDVTQGRVRYAS